MLPDLVGYCCTQAAPWHKMGVGIRRPCGVGGGPARRQPGLQSAVLRADLVSNLQLPPYPAQPGAEMCGTLKNIVALGAGIVDGLGLGPNSKATIIRQGLVEMRSFTKALYPTARDDTFLECCGVGDLVATCTGGRNRLVAEAWTKAHSVRAGGQLGLDPRSSFCCTYRLPCGSQW